MLGAGVAMADQSVIDGINAMIDARKARAVVFATWHEGESSVAAFGRVSRSDDKAPDADTQFEIGSVTKVFTSLLVESLVADKRLDWQDTLAERWSDIEFASESVAGITLAELARHESGLPRLPGNFEIKDAMDPYADYDRERLVTFLESYDPPIVDKSYEYSNLGVGILGEIAADATSERYGDALRDRVLEPLGMTSSGVTIRDDLRLAAAYSDGADMANWSGFDALAGAGALVSTANDLLRFIDAQFSGESDDLAALTERARESNVAFGWHKDTNAEGETVFWHNGATGGYASFLGIDPSARYGVVLLTASTDAQTVTNIGMSALIGAADDLDPSAYIGTYELAPGFRLSIFEESGALFGQATSQGAFPLTADGEHRFTFEAAQIEIVFNVDGTVSPSMEFSQRGNVRTAPRVSDEPEAARYEEIDIDPAVLPDYAGEFALTPLAILTVFVRDDQLFAQLTGQPAYPVFPFEDDKFFYRVVDAQLLFERNDDGDIVAVVLRQNGEQRAPKR